MPWYDHATVFYDWIRYGEDLNADYAQWLVQKTVDVHADTLAFCVQVGGYALWNSKVSPKFERLGDMDLLQELSQLCRQRGIHFVPWWLGTAPGVERILREHPDWQLRGPSVDGAPGVRHNYICYNSPYRELLFEEVREVLESYDVDGIYFDQLPGSCYCSSCKTKFSQLYGEEMPVVPNEFFVYDSPAGLPSRLQEFRDGSVRSFCASIRAIIDSVKPGTCYAQNWVRSIQSHLARGFADVILPEFYQRDDLIPLGLRHRLTKTYFDNGCIWGNVRHGVRHDARHFPVRSTKLLLFDCVANLATPVMLDLCAMDFDSTGIEQLAETFDHIRTVQEFQEHAEPVRYAALLHSISSHRLHRSRFEEAFEGMYRLLFETHIPFEIVNENSLQRGELADYKVLIIPDAMALADETVSAIRTAVDHGVGLVATFATGLFDDKGHTRPQPAFADILGYIVQDFLPENTQSEISRDPVLGLPDIDGPIFRYGSARSAHPLAEGIPPRTLFSFQGGFLVCRPADDAQVVADVHAVDQVRLNSRPYNRRGHYPGPARWPLLLVREQGKARCAYFSVQAEAEIRRAHAPELDRLLAQSIRWAGGPLPLDASDCPRTVELRLYHDPESRAYQLLVVNLTTNSLVRAAGGPAVVRYITPHKGIRVSLQSEGNVTAVRSMLGNSLSYSAEKSQVVIDLPYLDLYDSILVEYD